MVRQNENYQTITELFSLTKSELNKKMIQESQMKAYQDYCKEQQCSKYSFLLRKFFLNQYVTDKMCTELNRIYNDGFGIKSIAKSIGISYTNCRYLLGSSGIDLRTGHDVVTDTLRLSRKNKAIKEKLNKTGWFREDVRAHLMIKSKTHRGVQGWYFNLSKQK